MASFVGSGPPTGITVYFDTDAGELWTLGPTGWVKQGTTPPPSDPPPVPAVGLKARLLEDMTTGHEGNLDGVPDGWDWAHNPKHGDGWNNPGDQYQAAVVWGQVYSSTTPVEAVVEVGNLHLAVLSKASNSWAVLQSTRPVGMLGIDGGYYKSDFAGNESRPTANTPQGTLTGTPNLAWNLHYYANQRTRINNDDIAHVCVWHEARLAPGSDPRARYLAGAGGDYWQSLDSPYPSNTDIAIGKHRYLKVGEWTTLTAHTMSAHDLDTLPLPPVVLAGGGSTPPVDPPPAAGWQFPQGRPAKVMFVGDSITVMMAEDPAGLATLASQVPLPVELVGGQTSSSGIRHEGRGAWCADDTLGRCTHTNGYHAGGVAQQVGGWVATHRPDIVVLNIGQNDRYVRDSYNAAQTATAIGLCVDAVHQINPTVMVCVTQFGRDNLDVNGPLAVQITSRVRAGANVRRFDMYQGFEDQDWQGQGNIHPSPSGVQKMVAATATALTVLASTG